MEILSALFAGGGSILGIIRFLIEVWQENKDKQAQREAERDKLIGNQLIAHTEALAKVGRIEEIDNDQKLILKLWDREFGFEWKSKSERLITSFPIKCLYACLVCFVCTYCFTLGIFALDSQLLVWTRDPSQEPTSFGILWGLFDTTLRSTQVDSFTTGGVAYLMAQPILGLFSFALVNRGLKSVTGK